MKNNSNKEIIYKVRDEKLDIVNPICNGELISHTTTEALNTLEFSEDVATIKEGAFKGCNSLLKIAIPETVTEIGEGAFDCNSLVELYVEAKNPPIISVNIFKEGVAIPNIYIPNESLVAYENAEGWKDYRGHFIGWNVETDLPAFFERLPESGQEFYKKFRSCNTMEDLENLFNEYMEQSKS